MASCAAAVNFNLYLRYICIIIHCIFLMRILQNKKLKDCNTLTIRPKHILLFLIGLYQYLCYDKNKKLYTLIYNNAFNASNSYTGCKNVDVFFTHEVKICNKNIHVTNYEIVITILQLYIVSNINNVITVITVLNYAFSRAHKVRFSLMQ